MKYYEFENGDVLAVIDKELMQNAPCFRLKCRYILHNPHYTPDLSFRNETFFMIKVNEFSKLKEISEKEFKVIIKNDTIKTWKELKEKHKNDEVFALEPKARFLRDAYVDYYLDGDWDKFQEFYDKL